MALSSYNSTFTNSGTGAGNNVTVIVTATGGTASATGGMADATGGMNTNNDNDTNTATNTGRRLVTYIERILRRLMMILMRLVNPFLSS